MDVITIARTMVRRWYVSLSLLVVTIAALLLVMARLPPVHQASTTVLVVGSSQSVVGTDVVEVNPYLTLGDSVKVVALAGVSVMSSQQTRDLLLEEKGVDAEYTVAVQPDTSFVDFVVTGKDEADVARSMDAILASFSDVISKLQARSPAEQRLTVQHLQEPNFFETDPKSSQRLLAMIVVLGLMASVGLALLTDVVLGRRSRSRAARTASSALAAPSSPRAPAPSSPATVRPDSGAARAGEDVVQSSPSRMPGRGDVQPDTVRLPFIRNKKPDMQQPVRRDDDSTARATGTEAKPPVAPPSTQARVR